MHDLGEAFQTDQAGFTLIELSIVLVIIGLLVGGVLVGQDLIRAAYVRAQISQIEKYNTAVNTFYGKYGELPGDMDPNTAAQFNFSYRSCGCGGGGDANGLIEGAYGGPSPGNNGDGYIIGVGEPLVFWVDLSTAGLIEGGFSSANENGPLGDIFNGGSGANLDGSGNISGTLTNLYLPEAKIGQGNYVYAWSGGPNIGVGNGDGKNYYSISAVSYVGMPTGWMYSNPGMTVAQAYAIDRKVDDGFPTLGRVFADYIGNVAPNQFPANAGGTAVSCFDNNTSGTPNGSGNYPGGGGAPFHYSLEYKNGTSLSCGLTFGFQ